MEEVGYLCFLSLPGLYWNNNDIIGVHNLMAKKNISNLTQEESKKFIPLQGEPIIEIIAEAVLETQIQTPETPIPAIKNQSELEAIIKELQKTVDTLKQKESTLIEKISALQMVISEKKELTERLTEELYETKQTALQLADSNSQLLEEIKIFKQPSQQTSQISKSIQYKKSHRSIERLQEKPNQDSEDFSKNTWLYD
jgi:FtsZ-binding cell division protein ZapB